MTLQLLSELNALEEEVEATVALPAELTVGQVVQPDILRCGPDTPLHQAAAAMQARHCSSILIVEADQPIGIWTERDALCVDFTDAGQFLRPIRTVMSTPVASIPSDTLLRTVASRFRRNGLRHFLVVDAARRPLGILSQTDVVVHQGIEHYLHLRTVGSVVRKDVPRLPAALALTEAAQRMRQQGSDAVLVEYPDGLHGILTERDLVRLIAEQPSGRSVGDLASRPLHSVPQELSLYRARNLLTEYRIRHVGVRQGDELLGLVSFAEIMSGIEVAYVRELQRALRVRDQALSASRRSLHLAEQIIENTLEGVIITDARGRITSVNPAFTRLTGYTEAEVLGKTPAVLSSGRHGPEFYGQMWKELGELGHWQGEIWNRRKSGEVFPEFLSITAITDEAGELRHYAAVFNDISKLKENEENIRNLAYYDPLTGLPNRRLLEDRLDMAIAHAHRHGTSMGLLFIDLDRFKHINDSLGHAGGDALLAEVARRLKHCVREDDTVARLGGDEFIIVLSDVDHAASVHQAAERVLHVLRAPLRVQQREVVITCSVGVSVYPDHGIDREALLKHADAAMYQVKENGRDGLSAHAPSSPNDHLALELGLRRALANGELRLHYQPLIDADGTLAGAEALLRWRHPELGQVPPGVFIPLAEESGLILSIGDFVLREATEQLARWRRQGLHLPGVSVNVSGRQLRDDSFVGRVGELLEQAGVPPAQLTLELTESVLMDEVSVPSVRALKALGLKLALDDFGTGYCALIYLKRFEIDRLKIDRGFINDMLENNSDAAIVSAVIGLAKRLELEVVAEGVESRWQLEALKVHGCDMFQGFLFAPALPANEFAERFLEPTRDFAAAEERQPEDSPTDGEAFPRSA